MNSIKNHDGICLFPQFGIGNNFANTILDKVMGIAQNIVNGHCIQWDKLLMDAGAEAVAIVVGVATSIGNSYLQGWSNVKSAVKIYLNPHASISDRILSGLYIGTWITAHFMVVAGAAILAYVGLAYTVAAATGGATACGMNPECEDEASQTGSTFIRYMSEEELRIVNQSGFLRGGIPGVTHMTTDFFETIGGATSRLAMPTPPEVGVEFQIINNPVVFGPGPVGPDNGMLGLGIEYFSYDPVKVNILTHWDLLP